MTFNLKRNDKTNIIATLGPVTNDDLVLEKIIKAGVTVARLNFSHGDFVEHTGRLKAVRKISKKLKNPWLFYKTYLVQKSGQASSMKSM